MAEAAGRYGAAVRTGSGLVSGARHARSVQT